MHQLLTQSLIIENSIVFMKFERVGQSQNKPINNEINKSEK
jgi:hypothetical protein